jgi:hypothetical protein
MLLQGRNNRLHSQYLLQQNLTLHYYSAHSPDKLQKLQNRAARVLTSSSYDTNADYLFEKSCISA